MTAVPSVQFPFKGSDTVPYSGQTLPIDTNGLVPMSAGGQAAATAGNQTTEIAALQSIVASLMSTTSSPVVIGSSGISGDVSSFTAGGTAQTLFSGVIPTNGFALYNPNASDDCWVSDSSTAAPNGAGSIRLAANGGGYETPPGYKPVGAVSLWCPTTGDKMTARRW